jgi:hypothetical protein
MRKDGTSLKLDVVQPLGRHFLGLILSKEVLGYWLQLDWDAEELKGAVLGAR